jgi:hypothetical protein
MEDFANGAGPGGGLGNKHGSLGSPLEPCPYAVDAGSGPSQKGGEPGEPFGAYKQSPSSLPIVVRVDLSANVGASGRIDTPMDNPSSALPGVGGASGTGPKGAGGISTPFVSPWGESAG